MHPVARSEGEAHRGDGAAGRPGAAVDDEQRFALPAAEDFGFLQAGRYCRKADIAVFEGNVCDQPFVGALTLEIDVCD